MEDTFSEIKTALSKHGSYNSESELSQSAMNLVSFFEILMEIDREQSDKKEGCNENIRSEHQLCDAL